MAIQSYVPASGSSILASAQRIQTHLSWPALRFSAWAWRLRALLLAACVLSSLAWALHRQEGLQDLGSFLHSGASYREHLNPYGYHAWLDPQPIGPDALNLNPPISVYAFAGLAALPSELVSAVFFGATVILLGAGFYLLMRAYPEKRDPVVLLTVCSLAGVWHTLGYLQIYAPLIVGVIAAWLLLRRGNLLLAGLLIGLVVAVKPNFVLWPMLLLAAGQPRVAIAAFASSAAVSALPLIVDGPEIYRQWLDVSLSFQGIEWASNASLSSVGARFGSQAAGLLLALGLFAGLSVWFARTKPPVLQASSLSVVVVLLVGPVSWAGYTLFLLPYLFSRPWTRLIWLVMFMLATPFWLVRYLTMLGPAADSLVGSIYAWGVLLLFAVMVWEQWRAAKLEQKPVVAAAA